MRSKAASDTGHLLIVDDNKVNRLLLARGLEQQRHMISCVTGFGVPTWQSERI